MHFKLVYDAANQGHPALAMNLIPLGIVCGGLLPMVFRDGVGMSGDVKGNGLGLHLLQGFSRAMKGHVDIRSTSDGTSASLKFEAPSPERNLEFEHRSTTIH